MCDSSEHKQIMRPFAGVMHVHVINRVRMLQTVHRSLVTMPTNGNAAHVEGRQIHFGDVCQYSVRKLNIPSTF